MHHSFTKQCVTWVSAFLLGMSCHPALAQSKPQQKALIQFDTLLAKWKSPDKPVEAPADAVTESPKALIPPGSFFNRQVPAPTTTPLPPTSLVTGQAPVMQATNVTRVNESTGAPIATTMPATMVAQAQLLANQVPQSGGQAPVIIVVPGGLQPGQVNFAPREISPEVPNDFWPVESRNPLGRRDDHGLFNWPKFAKSIASETVNGPSEAAKEPAVAAADAPVSKALLARSENKPATSQVGSKALFGRSETSSLANQSPPTAQGSRALLALDRPAAPPAKPAEEATPKSKALFAFGRKQKSEPSTVAATPASQVATAAVAPVASVPAATESNELPPAAPTLAVVKAAPPVETSSGLKWRAKGSPQSVAAETPVSAPNHGAVAAAPAISSVTEPPATSRVSSAGSPPVMTSPTTTSNTPAMAPATTTQSNQKALLSIFARKSKARPSTQPVASQAVTQASAAPSTSAAPRKADEKALLPDLLAMASRVKNAALDVDATSAPTEPPVVTASVVMHVATPTPVDTESIRSYYAPPVERVAEPEVVGRPMNSSRPQTSRRNAAVVNECVVTPCNNSRCEDHEHETTDELRYYGKPDEDVAREASRSVDCERCPGTPSKRLAVAKNSKIRSYRKLTLQDLAAGFARPLSVVNEMTKLPFATHEPGSADLSQQDESSYAEQDTEIPVRKRAAVVRNTLKFDEPIEEFFDEETTTDHPDVVVAKPQQRKPPAAANRPKARTVRPKSQTAGDEIVASDRDEMAPSAMRSGRRQVAVPVVALEDVGNSETEGVSAMQIRNRRGARVLIFSGSAGADSENAEDRSVNRENPLR